MSLMKVAASPVNVTSLGDMSQATLTLGPIDIRNSAGWAILLTATGAPVGTCQVQACIGYPKASQAPGQGDWSSWPFVNIGSSVAVSAAGNILLDSSNYGGATNASAIQVVYTKTSGTGTLKAWVQVKG